MHWPGSGMTGNRKWKRIPSSWEPSSTHNLRRRGEFYLCKWSHWSGNRICWLYFGNGKEDFYWTQGYILCRTYSHRFWRVRTSIGKEQSGFHWNLYQQRDLGNHGNCTVWYGDRPDTHIRHWVCRLSFKRRFTGKATFLVKCQDGSHGEILYQAGEKTIVFRIHSDLPDHVF